jgi:hypothetical protein
MGLWIARVRPWLPWLALAAVVVGFANFLSFFVESTHIGGDALNGSIRDGHYFVVSHGSSTEVDRATWEWSRIHALSLFVTHPLAMVGMGYLLLRVVFPLFITSGGAREARPRVEMVKASGEMIAGAQCGGRLGDLSASSFDVLVYPAGVIVKPMLMAPLAILVSEVRAVIPGTRVLFRRGIKIDHDSPVVATPLVVFLARNHPVIAAIERITGLTADAPAGDDGAGSMNTGARRSFREDKFPPVLKALIVLGFILSIAFLVWIPGPRWGVLDTIALAAILIGNVYIFLIRYRRRW